MTPKANYICMHYEHGVLTKATVFWAKL